MATTSGLFNAPKPSPSGLDRLPEDQKYDDAMQKIMDSLSARQNKGYNPQLMAIAQGMLAPSATGSFGEGLGNTAKYVQQSLDQQNKENFEDAQFQLQAAQAQREQARKNQVAQAAGSLYKTTTDAEGNESFDLDPVAAQRFAMLTGDPKYLGEAAAAKKTMAIQNAKAGVFKPNTTPSEEGKPSTSALSIDPSQLAKMFKLGAGKEAMEIISNIPKMRQVGLLATTGAEGTPFDAIAAMAKDPIIKKQAQDYAARYRLGLIPDDKADNLAKDILTMMTAHMDRETANATHQAIATLNLGLRKEMNQISASNIDFNQWMKTQQLETRIKEQEAKMTDQQKIDYKTIVVPILNEGVKAGTALGTVKALERVIETAPSGAISGAYASSVGKLFGTDDNTALQSLQSLSKQLITQIPRLPGSQSNFDAQNLEKSIGDLANPLKTNKQRIELLTQVKQGFERLGNRASEVETHWESNKKVPQWVITGNAPPPPAAPAAPAGGTPRFRVIGTEPVRAQ
jgi:hypothetical protein